MGNNIKQLNNKNISQVITLQFKNSQWCPLKIDKPPILVGKEISFITYNVWFENINWDNRLKALVEIFEQYSPDFLCLQEVTAPFLDFLMSHSHIQKNYYISGNFKEGYDVLILSKYQTNYYTVSFPSNMGRNLLFTTLQLNDKEDLVIATSHFESLQNETKRKIQLEITFKELNNFSSSFLMGDFNFDPSWKEQENIDPNYVDSWKLHCEDNCIEEKSGFTMPANKYFPAWRPDRLLFKPKEMIKLNKFEIIGKNKINTNPDEYGNVETPSDHYGLYGKFDLLK
jgi:tyrosyl-DNA phosphodiesterase 2